MTTQTLEQPVAAGEEVLDEGKTAKEKVAAAAEEAGEGEKTAVEEKAKEKKKEEEEEKEEAEPESSEEEKGPGSRKGSGASAAAEVEAVAESAALAVGILGEAAGADALLGLALDRPTGRALCGRSTVPLRMRTFALYGLGLIAEACPDPALQVRIADALLTLLESGGQARPDLSAAAVTALGLTRLPWQSPGGPARTDRGEVVSRLHRLLAGDRRGKGALRHDAARAQVPTRDPHPGGVPRSTGALRRGEVAPRTQHFTRGHGPYVSRALPV